MARTRHKTLALLVALGSTTLAGSCTADMRDAVVSGVFDFVAGTTTALLDEWLPIVPLFSPDAADDGQAAG